MNVPGAQVVRPGQDVDRLCSWERRSKSAKLPFAEISRRWAKDGPTRSSCSVSRSFLLRSASAEVAFTAEIQGNGFMARLVEKVRVSFGLTFEYGSVEAVAELGHPLSPGVCVSYADFENEPTGTFPAAALAAHLGRT